MSGAPRPPAPDALLGCIAADLMLLQVKLGNLVFGMQRVKADLDTTTHTLAGLLARLEATAHE